MSKSQMPQKQGPSKNAGSGASSMASAAGAKGTIGADSPLEQQMGFGNSFIARALVLEASEQVGGPVSLNSMGAAMLGEDPGKYEFAEDGDDKDKGAKAKPRRSQEMDLPALRPNHADKSYEDVDKGVPFKKGEGDSHEVDPNDARQGALGDCYLIAGMAAVARADPDQIKKLIKDNGDGTFDVTLYLRSSAYGRPRPVTQTIDAQLAMKAAGQPLYANFGDQDSTEIELWAALIEKAVAQKKGSYDKISGGNINKDGFQFAGAGELLTGKYESYQPTSGMDEDDALLTISIALDDKKPIVCSTYDMKDDAELTAEANKWNVYGNHAYAPQSVDLDGRTINLQNPWGSHHVEKLPVKNFMKYYKAIRQGA